MAPAIATILDAAHSFGDALRQWFYRPLGTSGSYYTGARGGASGTVELTYRVDPDRDALDNVIDNCSLVPNADQSDVDGDGRGDACDLCPAVEGGFGRDYDRDGLGDECDCDDDGDGCNDRGGDALGTPCVPSGPVFDRYEYATPDLDVDVDGVIDDCDGLIDLDGDGIDEAIDDDRDNDGVPNSADNCPELGTSLVSAEARGGGVIVGAPGANRGRGVVELYGPNGRRLSRVSHFGLAFGSRISIPGDLDGDGRADVLVGVAYEEAGTLRPYTAVFTELFPPRCR